MRDVVRVIPLIAAAVSSFAQSQAPPSSADRPPTFEVASVKLNTNPSAPTSIDSLPGRFTATNAPFRLLLNSAYKLASYQYVGLPNWSERFNVAAKVPDGAPLDQIPLMLQSLLAQRFKMAAHRETRDSPIYVLVMARTDRRLGPQLTKSTIDCAPILAERRATARIGGPTQVQQRAPGDRPVCGARMIGRPGPNGLSSSVYSAGNTTMSKLAEFLQGYLGRQVLDRTELEGEFDLNLQFALPPSVSPAGPLAPIDDSPSLFTAVQEQLGLKLESTRGPVEYLVIDRVERPVDDQ